MRASFETPNAIRFPRLQPVRLRIDDRVRNTSRRTILAPWIRSDAFARLDREIDGGIHWQPSRLVDHLLELEAFQALHHKKGRSVGDAIDIQHAPRSIVRGACRVAPRRKEAVDGLARRFEAQEGQCDGQGSLDVRRAEDPRHCATAEDLFDTKTIRDHVARPVGRRRRIGRGRSCGIR